ALGAAPAMGRVLQPVDYPVDAARAVVISDRLWRTQFGSRRDIVGLTVEISGIKRPIVGVMPPGARWPIDTDVWVPMRFTTEQDEDLQRRDNYVFTAIARLKAGTTIERTRASMARRKPGVRPRRRCERRSPRDVDGETDRRGGARRCPAHRDGGARPAGARLRACALDRRRVALRRRARRSCGAQRPEPRARGGWNTDECGPSRDADPPRARGRRT